MLNESDKNKLNGYFGFAQKKRCLFVGFRLEEAMEKKKVCYLIFTSSCPEKVKNDLLRLAEKIPNLVIYSYEGDYPISLSCGYEKLNALALSDSSLGKAIVETLKKDVK